MKLKASVKPNGLIGQPELIGSGKNRVVRPMVTGDQWAQEIMARVLFYLHGNGYPQAVVQHSSWQHGFPSEKAKDGIPGSCANASIVVHTVVQLDPDHTLPYFVGFNTGALAVAGMSMDRELLYKAWDQNTRAQLDIYLEVMEELKKENAGKN